MLPVLGFALASQDDGGDNLIAKKVPPRTPPQRLETLGRFKLDSIRD